MEQSGGWGSMNQNKTGKFKLSKSRTIGTDKQISDTLMRKKIHSNSTSKVSGETTVHQQANGGDHVGLRGSGIDYINEILKYHTCIDRSSGKPKFEEFENKHYFFVLQADLSALKLSEVPVQLKYLKCLESLDFSHNNLSKFNLAGEVLETLRNISELNLSNNEVKYFPKSILQLTNLKILNLANNRISKIPSEISALEDLRFLDVSHNHLTELPEKLFDLQKLNCLILASNNLKQIPNLIYNLFELYQLDLSFNQIETVEKIQKLAEISVLDLSYNPIKHPPQDIIRRGVQAIFEYLDNYNSNTTENQNGFYQSSSSEEEFVNFTVYSSKDRSVDNLSKENSEKMRTIKRNPKSKIHLTRFDLIHLLNKQTKISVDNKNIETEVRNGTVLCDWLETVYPGLINMKEIFIAEKSSSLRKLLPLSDATRNSEKFLQACIKISKDFAQYCSVNNILNSQYGPIMNLINAILAHKKNT